MNVVQAADKHLKLLVHFCSYSLSITNGVQNCCIPCNLLDLNSAKEGYFFKHFNRFFSAVNFNFNFINGIESQNVCKQRKNE